jgi:ubiquinone/menaquinone biosynthesis C-methylase UbiE
MNSYSRFAKYYDILTQDIDYISYAKYIKQLFELHHSNPYLILDLACGTGSLSFALEKIGYDVIGIDNSEQMLSQALSKTGKYKSKVIFICQNMQNLDLYGTVDAAICSLDSMNHLTSVQKITDTFKKVSLFLNPDGLFIFDMNSEYKFENILGDNTFVYDYDEIYCIWQNSFNHKTKLCRFDLTFFENNNDIYTRYDESFYEKSYSQKNIKKYLCEAGLILENIFEENTINSPTDECQRYIYVARKANLNEQSNSCNHN